MDAVSDQKVTITLPWPPSINHYWRTVGQRLIVKDPGKRYRVEVATECFRQQVRRNFGGRLAVNIDAFPPDNRRRDLDNILKALLDALTVAHVWVDDSQIDDLRIARRPPDKTGWVRVMVHES